MELIQAVQRLNFGTVHEILKSGKYHGRIDEWDEYDQMAAIHHASQAGILNICKILLEYGADMETRQLLGETPLHVACKWGSLDVANFLIAQGADLNARDDNGWTPLHSACFGGHLALVRRLLIQQRQHDNDNDEHKAADVMALNEAGMTPLHMACDHGHLNIVRELLGHPQVDVNAKTKFSKDTPLHITSGTFSFPNLLHISRELILHGANLNDPNGNGDTPLHLASQCGRIQLARLLLRNGAAQQGAGTMIVAKNDCGKTALEAARANGHLGIMKLFHQHLLLAEQCDNHPILH
eukprot:CAMPEP_0198139390 /NCGR_PEP_ID=MMETSP1443-20131203/2699_1 /TAXON_ID=186043 /ORGANISM="Entomoneis sp., Strain CCMP2396" /LENGTH=295 /DNA_ID=CAMNT_0043801503 /DNA_START=96 /DNA_END=983 /DNA_ORIENTATION=+